MSRDIPIRALSRGLAVLSTVNRDGPMSMMDIAKATNLPYPTTSRVVQTLLHEGMIEKEAARKYYRATSLVTSLSTGFQWEDGLVDVARPHIKQLCLDTGWPISIVTRVGTRMVIRDSTHRMTSQTFSNYYPGYTLPISECASGKIYLAFCKEAERDLIAEAWKSTDSESARRGLLLIRDEGYLNQLRTKGYALNFRNIHNAEPGKTSSLSVPILNSNGEVLAALTMIYFSSAMNSEEAVDKFLRKLQSAAGIIGGQAKPENGVVENLNHIPHH